MKSILTIVAPTVFGPSPPVLQGCWRVWMWWSNQSGYSTIFLLIVLNLITTRKVAQLYCTGVMYECTVIFTKKCLTFRAMQQMYYNFQQYWQWIFVVAVDQSPPLHSQSYWTIGVAELLNARENKRKETVLQIWNTHTRKGHQPTHSKGRIKTRELICRQAASCHPQAIEIGRSAYLRIIQIKYSYGIYTLNFHTILTYSYNTERTKFSRHLTALFLAEYIHLYSIFFHIFTTLVQ